MTLRFHNKAIFAAAVVVAGVAGIANAQDAGMQAPLLAKGEDFLVHAVPQAEGYVLTYLVPSSGVMKALTLSDHPQCPTEGDVRTPRKESRGRKPARGEARTPASAAGPSVYIVAATADEQRLYVLLRVTGIRRGGFAMDDEEPRRDALAAHLRLQAFSLTDGLPLLGPNGYGIASPTEESAAEDFARFVAADGERRLRDSLSAGPLQLDENSVNLFNTSLTFDGGSVTNLKFEDREFTPPPGFFDERRMLR